MGAVKTYGSCKEKELCVSLYVVHAGTWMIEYKIIIKNENAAFSIFFLQAVQFSVGSLSTYRILLSNPPRRTIEEIFIPPFLFFLNFPSESFPVAGHISYSQTTSNLRGTGPRSAIA